MRTYEIAKHHKVDYWILPTEGVKRSNFDLTQSDLNVLLGRHPLSLVYVARYHVDDLKFIPGNVSTTINIFDPLAILLLIDASIFQIAPINVTTRFTGSGILYSNTSMDTSVKMLFVEDGLQTPGFSSIETRKNVFDSIKSILNWTFSSTLVSSEM